MLKNAAARFSEIYRLFPMKPIVPFAPRPSPVTATMPTVCVRGSPFGLVICRIFFRKIGHIKISVRP